MTIVSRRKEGGLCVRGAVLWESHLRPQSVSQFIYHPPGIISVNRNKTPLK
jgi:hypothetical protein